MVTRAKRMGGVVTVNKMVNKKNCSSEVRDSVVKLGNNSRGVSFSLDSGNDQEAFEKEIREVYLLDVGCQSITYEEPYLKVT